MVLKVVMTKYAYNQLKQYIGYIKEQFKSEQAASAVLEDARDTNEALKNVAESLKYCDDPELKALGYRTIHFKRHRYFYVYEVKKKKAYIEAVYHDLQDYENIFKSTFL